MSITPGATGRADDFITEAERNANPGLDSGRIAQLESDGKIHVWFTRQGFVPNAGETINGATVPVPVYQDDSDAEVYACDGNVTTKLRFRGFAISNSTNGSPIKVQTKGSLAGFPGGTFTPGKRVYVQDAVGTVGHTPGTYEILVGEAESSTVLTIVKGLLRANGTLVLGTSPSNQVINVGFRPSRIRITAVNNAVGNQHAQAHLAWSAAGASGVYKFSDVGGTPPNGSGAGSTVELHADDTNYTTIGIDSLTDTGFRITLAAAGTGPTAHLLYEVEGD